MASSVNWRCAAKRRATTWSARTYRPDRCSQLALRGETPCDPKLQHHFKDYEERLNPQYGDDHQTAFQESKIPELQRQVLEFLNDRLRSTTLVTAVTNVEQSLCQPLLHHLRLCKEKDDNLVRGEFKESERGRARALIEEHLHKRRSELKATFRAVRDKVATERATMFADEAKELEETLRREIRDGCETDAYEVYKRIIADNSLRKYPYYFEIEMKVVDSLNSLLKRRFREIVRDQVDRVVRELVKGVRDHLATLNADIAYDADVSTSLEDLIAGVERRFQDRIDGVVMDKAAHLDELLLYRQRGFMPFFGGGNEIVEGLEKAARMQTPQIRDAGRAVRPEDMEAKTSQIRATLEGHYIRRTVAFREQVAESVFPILINEMLDLEKSLGQRVDTKYRAVLEQLKAQEAHEEFAGERARIETRSKRFREAIERIQEASTEMRELAPLAHA